MPPSESSTRPTFLVRLAGTQLDRLRAPARRDLLTQLDRFAHDPRERLRGEMRPRPTAEDLEPIQRGVRMLLEGTVLPGTTRTEARTGWRPDAPALTIQDLHVTSLPSRGALDQAIQTAVREGREVQVAADVYRLTVRAAPLDVVLLLAIVTLSQGDLPAVAHCGDPYCPQRWFVRRGKKRFCSDQCRNRLHMRELRAARRHLRLVRLVQVPTTPERPRTAASPGRRPARRRPPPVTRRRPASAQPRRRPRGRATAKRRAKTRRRR